MNSTRQEFDSEVAEIRVSVSPWSTSPMRQRRRRWSSAHHYQGGVSLTVMVSKLLKHPNKKSKQPEIAIGHLLLSHVSPPSSLSRWALGQLLYNLLWERHFGVVPTNASLWSAECWLKVQRDKWESHTTLRSFNTFFFIEKYYFQQKLQQESSLSSQAP
jgi:hypothetical protein